VIVASPTTVRQAAVLVALEGAATSAAALVYVISGFGGAEVSGLNKYGTALWFAIMGAGVLAAGWALWTGRRWGRGIAVFAQLLLLPVAWYMGPGSHQWGYAIPVALVAVLTMVLLFSPSALEWLGQDSSEASSDKPGPDTR
jgi:peptidoglycan/LPS O-acetylase OafA/YrhL